MKRLAFFTLLLLSPASAQDGFKSIFNGKDLTGWDGNPELWSVEDGCITGKTTGPEQLAYNQFLIWRGGVVKNFELRAKIKQSGNNTGIQYRSKIVDEKGFVVAGYQGDFEAGTTYSGILYEEKGRGILAKRGEKVVIKEGAEPTKPKIEAQKDALGTSESLQAIIKQGDWNEYRIVAKGGHLQHFINGHQTVDVTDETAVGAKTGILALQLHAGPPMRVQFKNIVLKTE